MEEKTQQLIIECAVAAGVGLFIGLEREHSDSRSTEASPREPASPEGAAPPHAAPVPEISKEHLLGVRTFAILSLFGWASALLGERMVWLPPAAMLVAGGLIAAHYFRAGERDLGLTTEVAAATTFVLGMLVHHERDLAVILALAVTLLLISKPWVRRTVPKLRRIELTATLQLAIVLAVVLPLLPTEARDPWRVLSPRKIGLFIVLIAGISYVGYVLHRIFGASRGVGLAGLVGGLASSTAVTAAMAQLARKNEHMVLPGQLATLLANTVMFARVLVVTALISKPIAIALAVPLGAMGAVMLVGAGLKYWQLSREPPGNEARRAEVPLSNPFALLPALKWGLVLSVVLVASAVAQKHFGDQGLYVTAAASGLADVDAVTLAVSRQSQGGLLPNEVGALAIIIAVVSNTVVKGGMAAIMGGRAFGRAIVILFGLAIAVGVILAVSLSVM